MTAFNLSARFKITNEKIVDASSSNMEIKFKNFPLMWPTMDVFVKVFINLVWSEYLTFFSRLFLINVATFWIIYLFS